MVKPKSKKEKELNEKKVALNNFLYTFQLQCEAYEKHLNSACKSACEKIDKLYTDKLKALPEDIRKMTLTEYMEYMKAEKQKQQEDPPQLALCHSQYEKSKLESERKKTLKKRKRSFTVSDCSAFRTNPLTNASRVKSDLCLNTPLSKRSAIPSHILSSGVVTPKFNTKLPISKAIMRKPRGGEVVISLSGSPLFNFVDDAPERPGVTLSLGGGKVIKITKDSEVEKLEKDFMKKLDAETKSTLANVKQTIDKILQS